MLQTKREIFWCTDIGNIAKGLCDYAVHNLVLPWYTAKHSGRLTDLRLLSVSVMPCAVTLKCTTVVLAGCKFLVNVRSTARVTATAPVKLSTSTLLTYTTLHATHGIITTHTRCPVITITLQPIGEANYCNDCVWMSVREHISGTICPIFAKFFMAVTYVRGSVFLRRRCNMLCTSCFMDDVIFAHNEPYS